MVTLNIIKIGGFSTYFFIFAKILLMNDKFKGILYLLVGMAIGAVFSYYMLIILGLLLL